MILELNNIEIEKAVKEKATKAIKIVASQLVTNVQEKIRKNKSIVTSNLINSIQAGDVDNLTVKVGTNVVYAPRVEFGFVGRDSLGRYYNQAPKSFMRSTIYETKNKLIKLFGLLMRNL